MNKRHILGIFGQTSHSLKAFIPITVFVLASCSGNSGNSTSSDSTNVDSSSMKMNNNNSSMAKLGLKGQDPAWGPSIKDEMLVVIEKLQSYGAPPLETLTP